MNRGASRLTASGQDGDQVGTGPAGLDQNNNTNNNTTEQGYLADMVKPNLLVLKTVKDQVMLVAGSHRGSSRPS